MKRGSFLKRFGVGAGAAAAAPVAVLAKNEEKVKVETKTKIEYRTPKWRTVKKHGFPKKSGRYLAKVRASRWARKYGRGETYTLPLTWNNAEEANLKKGLWRDVEAWFWLEQLGGQRKADDQ